MIDYKQLAIDCEEYAVACYRSKLWALAYHERACRDAILVLLYMVESAEKRGQSIDTEIDSMEKLIDLIIAKRTDLETRSSTEQLADFLVPANGGPSSDRLRELIQAYREERCTILPPKSFFQRLGDEVYILQDGEVFEAFLGFIGYTADGEEWIDAVCDLGGEDEERFSFKFSDVGETVFPTREEAEAALAKRKEN